MHSGGRIDYRGARSRRRQKEHDAEMYSEPDLETMQRVRCAFDPLHLSNPNKIFPRPRLCGEKRASTLPILWNRGNRGAVLNGRQRFFEGDCQHI